MLKLKKIALWSGLALTTVGTIAVVYLIGHAAGYKECDGEWVEVIRQIGEEGIEILVEGTIEGVTS